MLSYGVTTIVTDDAFAGQAAWEGESTPGPRVLAAGDIESDVADGSGPAVFFVRAPTRAADDAGMRERILGWQAQGVPVLAEDWNTGRRIGADLVLGAGAFAVSPGGEQHGDAEVASAKEPLALVSGLADAATPGLGDLLHSRQARELGQARPARRRFTS